MTVLTYVAIIVTYGTNYLCKFLLLYIYIKTTTNTLDNCIKL